MVSLLITILWHSKAKKITIPKVKEEEEGVEVDIEVVQMLVAQEEVTKVVKEEVVVDRIYLSTRTSSPPYEVSQVKSTFEK